MTENLLDKTSKRASLRPVFRMALMAAVALVAISCNKEDDFSRSKNVVVYSDAELTTSTSKVVCRADGGEVLLYVRANTPYTMKFRTGASSEWARCESLGVKNGVETVKVTYDAVPDGNYARRTGTLSFSAPDQYLGRFVTLSQGFSTRLEETFDWIATGYASPLEALGDPVSRWSTTWKGKGWNRNYLTDEDECYLYAKRGYVCIGDETHNGELSTPDLARMVSDRGALLTFKALKYVDAIGFDDAGVLTVSVERGGEFADGTKSKTIQLPGYDYTDVESIWDILPQRLMLVSTKQNPFTVDTRVVFSTKNAPAGKANRVFIDDVYMYIMDADGQYLIDEFLAEGSVSN